MDIKKPAQDLSSSRVLGVGESTHGTHEFFETKTKLIIELIKNHGFRNFMLEDGVESCESLNTYIKTGNGDIKQLLNGLYSVWRVEEIINLIEWLKKNYDAFPVEFIGFDINQTTGIQNISERDALMAQNILRCLDEQRIKKVFIWSHNAHVKLSSGDRGFKPMGAYLREQLGDKYIAIGQYFGIGSFSATIIDENNPGSHDRTLGKVEVVDIPAELLEYKLDKIADGPNVIDRADFKKNKLDKEYSARTIGWGLVPGKLKEYVEPVLPADEYDLIIYFPYVTHSKTIQL